ncbi:MAG: limonene,2-epoxide hydrolase [Frankiales bacterium]|nr:limonene,2-epoxide hydrolase [Frankiales bacterium]
MGARQEEIIRTFLDLWGDGEQPEPDIDAIVPMFSEDAVWQLWVPGGPTLRGREAIRADITRQLTFSTHMQCGLLRMTSDDHTVMTERLDHFRSGTVQVAHALVAIYELDDDGLITAWREYFDYKDVERQLKAANAEVPRAAQ